MTERANKAAAELRRRGWGIDGHDDETVLDKACQQCGYQMRSDSRFCQNCGTRIETGIADNALADIEAAIAAAVDDKLKMTGARSTAGMECRMKQWHQPRGKRAWPQSASGAPPFVTACERPQTTQHMMGTVKLAPCPRLHCAAN